MKIFKAVPVLLGILLLSSSAISAQQMMMPPQPVAADSVSDEELSMFVDTAMDIQQIRMEADSVIVARLEEEGMTPQRFQQIMMAQQNPASQLEVSEEEEAAITAMQPFLQEVSMDARQKQMTVIQESELSQERFQSIAMALQQDTELQTRFQQMAEDVSGN